VALPALAYAITVTHDLTWPYDVDFYREIAQAQVFADGDWSAEAFYRGERVWYPPLAPALVAGLARLTGAPVPLVYARVGAYVNFIAPIFLYLFVSGAFGRLVAFVTIVDYIYLRALWLPGWVAGSYSPWLFSGTFAQDCFIGGLFAYYAASVKPSGWRSALVGCSVALAALAHASAGLLLAGVIAGGALLQAWESASKSAVLRRHAVMALWAFLVAAPYYAVLAAHYWHGVANTAPALWIWSGLRSFNEIAAQWTFSLLLVPFGLIALVARERRRIGGQLVLLWIGLSVALLLASLVVALVPVHHSFAYLRAGLSVCVGAGAGFLVRGASRRVFPRIVKRTWVELAAALLALLIVFPSYHRRRDFWQGRLLSQKQASRRNQLDVYEWYRKHVAPEDVTLASDEFSMNVVGPAGRKVVAVPSLWASPFVDNERRRNDRDLMLAAFEGGQERLFCRLASDYGVTLVVRARREGPQPAIKLRHRLQRVFDNGKIYIEEIRGCAAAPRADASRLASPDHS
jgi:hypothetical protein